MCRGPSSDPHRLPGCQKAQILLWRYIKVHVFLRLQYARSFPLLLNYKTFTKASSEALSPGWPQKRNDQNPSSQLPASCGLTPAGPLAMLDTPLCRLGCGAGVFSRQWWPRVWVTQADKCETWKVQASAAWPGVSGAHLATEPQGMLS